MFRIESLSSHVNAFMIEQLNVNINIMFFLKPWHSRLGSLLRIEIIVIKLDSKFLGHYIFSFASTWSLTKCWAGVALSQCAGGRSCTNNK